MPWLAESEDRWIACSSFMMRLVADADPATRPMAPPAECPMETEGEEASGHPAVFLWRLLEGDAPKLGRLPSTSLESSVISRMESCFPQAGQPTSSGTFSASSRAT
eukprot:scaffold20725_cov111-Isochrysis_galbana.AAC.8